MQAIIALGLITIIAYAPNTQEYVREIDPCSTVEKCVIFYSKKHGIPYEKLDYIVFKESSYNPDAIGDMDITCPQGVNKGKPVRARGILQITECYYPEIPDSCAFDYKCSLETMAHLIKNTKTCKQQWTTCNNFYAIHN